MSVKQRSLLIDGQVFQSHAWDRGMGKYSFNLLKAVFKERHSFERVSVIFTKHMPLKKEAEAELKKILPSQSRWLFLDLKIPPADGICKLLPLQQYNERLLEDLIEEQNLGERPDFLILSLFVDQVCSVFPSNARRTLLFYDLIPLQYSSHYSNWAGYPTYLARYRTIMQADIFLTISQTVADDLAIVLGISKAKVCNIDGAPIQRVHQEPIRPRLDLPTRFILMPTGEEFRKNNHRAVQGFEEFRRQQSEDVLLVLTSFFTKPTEKELQALSPNVIFTGNVPEAELRWLYENCFAVLFAPEYEGLGLPILEAVEMHKPVTCSNLTVFNEMSPTAFYYADQFDPTSIAQALSRVIEQDDWPKKLAEYPTIMARYTWPNTAKRALKFLNEKQSHAQLERKPHLAVLAPNPRGYSAIGNVVRLLHPSLSEYFDIDYYLEDERTTTIGKFSRVSYLSHVATTYNVGEFNAKRYAQYDAVVYHIGNSEYHLDTAKDALHLPGYAIIHDTHAKGLFEEMNRYGYISNERMQVEQKLDQLQRSTKAEYLTSIVNAQCGIVTHSEYAKEAMQQIAISKEAHIKKLDLPTGTPSMTRQRLDDRFNIGFAGIIHPAKGIDTLEEIINAPEFSDAHIYAFGIPVVSEEVLNRLRVHPNVTLQLSPTDFEFQNILSQMDVIVSYRPKYNGESSQAVIDAMRFGVVPLVRKVGWFGELPDSCALKASTPGEVLVLLKEIRLDTKRRQQMSANARKLMKEDFSFEKYAKDLATFVLEDKTTGLNTRITQALKSRQPLQYIEKIIKSSSP